MPDPALEEQLARTALAEITPERTFGALATREVAEDGVVTMTFAATMEGYPGWHWTVSLAEVDGLEPTVLEAELLPGDGALLAPDWVPWSVRLDEYRAAQAAAGESDEIEGDDLEGDDLEADEDDDLDDDEDDLDEDDDLGDDPDDGIDFEDAAADSAAVTPEVGVDEQDDADGEPDDGGPEDPESAR